MGQIGQERDLRTHGPRLLGCSADPVTSASILLTSSLLIRDTALAIEVAVGVQSKGNRVIAE